MSERVVEFGPGHNLVGVFNNPPGKTTTHSASVVIFLNSGTLHRVGPCRLYVRLARKLADTGIASLRFDFSGIGDSPPRDDGLPFHQYSISEVADAIDYVYRSIGQTKITLVGMCSGADTAWYAAVADKRITDLVLLDGFAFRNFGYYWTHYKQRIFSFKVWRNFFANPTQAFSFLISQREAPTELAAAEDVVFDRDWPTKSDYDKGLRELVDRKVGLFYLFSGGANTYYNYSSQLLDSHPALDRSENIIEEYYPAADHMVSDIASQNKMMKNIVNWVRNRNQLIEIDKLT